MEANNVLELFGRAVTDRARWAETLRQQQCPYTSTKCFKVRKSQPEISIGTCTVRYGRDRREVMICPNRLLERRQVFTDCVHLLIAHEPGNEFHIIPEVSVPGGSVDYFLASVRNGRVKDFVGIEFQTLDTTGTVWPERQRLLKSKGISVVTEDAESDKSFGMNWKMTAKTILVQLHHKIQTFEHFNKHLVLVIQNHLLAYMQREFSFAHLQNARIGDSMHFHSYQLKPATGAYRLELDARLSTDAQGIAACLGLQTEARVELEALLADLEKKLSSSTLLTFGETLFT